MQLSVTRPLAAASALLLAVLLASSSPAVALPQGDRVFPEVIALPTGFQPEGIVVAPGATAYAGSLADGSIVAADLRTGRVRTVYEADGEDSPAVGIEYERSSRLLYVAGGPAGTLEVVDPRTGALVDRVALTGAGFANDVAVYRDTAYVTDSLTATIFAVELTDAGFGEVRAIAVHGDFRLGEGFNLNGIVALPPGELVAVQSQTGLLFAIDPDTGEAEQIELSGEATELPAGDGIEAQGRTLYVVQNQFNQIAVVRLRGRGATATVERVITDPAFDVPTTVDRFADRLYVVNARFGIQEPDDATFDIVGTSLR